MLDAERRIKQYIKERLDSRQKRLKSRVLDERQSVMQLVRYAN